MWRSTARSLIRTPLGWIAGPGAAGLATCLMYHRIVPDTYARSEFAPNLPLYVKESEFDHQMAYVARHTHPISVPELIQRLREGTLQGGSVAVTFDDGHRDNLELALPILKKYSVPATIYVTTGLMDGSVTSLWWYDHEEIVRRLERIDFKWRGTLTSLDTSTPEKKRASFFKLHEFFASSPPEEQAPTLAELRKLAGIEPGFPTLDALTWDEVKRLDNEPLITIGAHTLSHPYLTRLEPDALRREIVESKRVLERRLEHEVAHFAYPFGSELAAGKREFEAAKEAGFESAFTTRVGHIRSFHSKHLHALPRLAVAYGDDFGHFTFKLAGLEAFLKRPMSRFRAD